MFDNVADRAAVGPRERYEAVARSVRDVLSQRWVRTEKTYDQENPKRVYYLSMIQAYLFGTGPATVVPGGLHAFVRTSAGLDVPDIEFMRAMP